MMGLLTNESSFSLHGSQMGIFFIYRKNQSGKYIVSVHEKLASAPTNQRIDFLVFFSQNKRAQDSPSKNSFSCNNNKTDRRWGQEDNEFYRPVFVLNLCDNDAIKFVVFSNRLG